MKKKCDHRPVLQQDEKLYCLHCGIPMPKLLAAYLAEVKAEREAKS